jgi:PBSX family phage terminase large subunit
MKNIEVKLSDPQFEFMYSDSPYTLYCGGVGSGKTFAGALWAIMMSQEYPNTRGLITANTHSQLQKATLAEMFSICDTLGIKYRYLVNQNRVFIGKSEILCYTMEKPENLAGPTVGWWWGDEVAFYRPLAFDKASARVRDLKGPGQIKFTTTPNGFNWLYDFFITNDNDKKLVIRGSTMDNAVNLQGSYVERLREQYDSRMAQQELEGAFVNLNAGQVYYAFDRRVHVKEGVELKDTDLLLVGLDFNVHPLCGVFVAKRGGMIYIVDELYLENSNTFQAAKEIKARYPGRYIEVVADETGNRRRTNSNKTDHEIIRRAGLELSDFRNPAVKDRQNNMNRLFEHNYIKIHPRCKNLIKDLEQLVHDNKDDMLSHISDALGYVCWKLNPLVKPRRQARVLYK